MRHWLDAVGAELDAQRARAARTRAGASVGRAGTAGQDRLLAIADGTAAGRQLGEWMRKTGGVVNQLPVLSAFADTAIKRQCVDLLADRVRRNRGDTLAQVQLAEALTAARRDRVMVRYLRATFDPTTVVTGAAMRFAAGLGHDGREPTADELLRSAWQRAAAATRTTPSWAELLTISRVYRARGMPRVALEYALLAAHTARREQETIGPSEKPKGLWSRVKDAWELGGLEGAVDVMGTATAQALEDVIGPDVWSLPSGDLAVKKEGAALVVGAWALRDLGNLEGARRMADAAKSRTMTVAHEVKAALVDPDFKLSMGARLSERHDQLSLVALRDRQLYYGAARPTIAWMGEVAEVQAEKTVTLARKAFS